MKENVLDVLMYLFEHYFDDEANVESDQEFLKGELVQAGFPESEIGKAFAWLEGLAGEHSDAAPRGTDGKLATRVFTPEESSRMDLECRGFLVFLEQARILDAFTRELVIDRVMALETEDINIEQLKWVVLMVLFNQPGKETAFTWMEELVFDTAQGRLH